MREIVPKEISFSSNEWHKEEQWFLIAYDLEKKADRTFACKNLSSWYGMECKSLFGFLINFKNY